MTDRITKQQRSRLMSRIRSRDTKPELIVRSLTHRLGYRFRLFRRDLPGRPDLVFVARRSVIFVHGCFWHQHPSCRKATIPQTRPKFWIEKLKRNQERDALVTAALEGKGWRVLLIWECETRNIETLQQKIIGFLDLRNDNRLSLCLRCSRERIDACAAKPLIKK